MRQNRDEPPAHTAKPAATNDVAYQQKGRPSPTRVMSIDDFVAMTKRIQQQQKQKEAAERLLERQRMQQRKSGDVRGRERKEEASVKKKKVLWFL